MLRPAARLAAPLVLAAAVVSCTAPPDREIEAAREALQAARAAGAERYAAAEYDKAAAAMQRCERLVADGDYRRGRIAAVEAREAATEAAASAARALEAAREEVSNALRALEASIAAARAFTNEATEHPPASRAGRLHVSELRRAIVVGNVAVQKAREAMSRGDHGAASEALKGVRARLDEVMAARPRGPGR